MIQFLGEQERLRELELRNTTKKGKPVASLETDTVFNDFKREMMFHRQAQAAVLIGMPKLKELGVGTRRPDDYFAQMAKTDQHMHKNLDENLAICGELTDADILSDVMNNRNDSASSDEEGEQTKLPEKPIPTFTQAMDVCWLWQVRENLQKKQFEEARSEKAKKQRQLRKMGKQIQVQTKLRRESEKKQLAEEVKKYRKGLRTDLDFLEDSKKQRPGVAGQNKLPAKNKTQAKRQYKDKKFGFGGKKRGLKTNTKESSADFADYRHPKKPMKGQQQRPVRHGANNNNKKMKTTTKKTATTKKLTNKKTMKKATKKKKKK
uniref:Uncharacterized protein n=1 Tax=Timema tahoe TaxID=61484 RepID=A0A7R9NZV5_9NEOP|nr:unnamed protein product [Timema tahoe]